MIYVIVIILAASLALNLLLWRKLHNNSRKVAFLFNAIDNGDYAFRFPKVKGENDALLNASLNRIKKILQHARDSQIEREKYYELILDSVDTGILVVDEKRGNVLRSNKAARRMLKREAVTHISQVEEKLKAFSVKQSYTTIGALSAGDVYTYSKPKKIEILAFSDIHNELANQEIDAWIKLIRVLTHEIMNTVTPIISLSETSDSAPGNLEERLAVIHSTSKELMDFVHNYREFTHVPAPQPKIFYVKPFLERMASLSKRLLKPQSVIEVNVEPKELMVYADESLTSRVVSNIIKNASEATDAGGRITIKAYTGKNDNVTVDISDDGPDISPEIAAHIFVPFFTTKKQGSGVGLSISRQIMRTMSGMIELLPGKPTTFRLTFK